jgi:hypothetical protein
MPFIRLTEEQITKLKDQGCTSSDWESITVSDQTELSCLVRVEFSGKVQIGYTGGTITVDGVEMPCGIYNASLLDCQIGDHVRIANIGSVVSNYTIQDNVLLQDVAALVTEKESSFGNGAELETINEAGGRGVKIINELTSQIAYAQAMMQHNPRFSSNLRNIVEMKAETARARQGRVCKGARVSHCGSIKNVVIGPYAIVHGVLQLEDGTINSCAEHSTEIGDGVIARSFIVAEGAQIDGGAMLDKVFVGQGVKIGKQYSAENALFFANSEAFHGEAVSLFAGPYTVSHHKSTLLIAGLFSFYNAGSGTNQSNHMYKLGPVHQGVLERGCKTGSSSYLLWEAHVGAFSVVIGKHYVNIQAPHLPFSYFFEGDGGSHVIPGRNLISIGTVRDGEKWLARDYRKAPVKRDLIVFDVFSPYTVEKMRLGKNELRELEARSANDALILTYGGLHLNRSHLQKGVLYYTWAIERYLNSKVALRLKDALIRCNDWKTALSSLVPISRLRMVDRWTDLGGLVTPVERVEELEEKVAGQQVRSYDDLLKEFEKMYHTYADDEWQYIYEVFAHEYKLQVNSLSKEQAEAVIERWIQAEEALHNLLLEDSKKEFGAFARIGYGLDRTEEQTRGDFEFVRGTEETSSVVRKLVKELGDLHVMKLELIEMISAFQTN